MFGYLVFVFHEDFHAKLFFNVILILLPMGELKMKESKKINNGGKQIRLSLPGLIGSTLNVPHSSMTKSKKEMAHAEERANSSIRNFMFDLKSQENQGATN